MPLTGVPGRCAVVPRGMTIASVAAPTSSTPRAVSCVAGTAGSMTILPPKRPMVLVALMVRPSWSPMKIPRDWVPVTCGFVVMVTEEPIRPNAIDALPPATV